MTDTNLDAAAPLDPSSDPSAVTRPPEREMEIVDIAVAPLPSSASSENGTAQAPSAPAAEIPVLEDVAEADADDPLATLSPAVRRLVRQYDLDVTGVQGTGHETVFSSWLRIRTPVLTLPPGANEWSCAFCISKSSPAE